MALRICALAGLLIFVLAVGAAYAAGGIYIDNLKITNNGKVIFSDSFDGGKLVGWTKMTDASWIPDGPNTQKGALLLNKHGSVAATAYHGLSSGQSLGVVEMSAEVFCTAPSEQYGWAVRKGACGTFFRLYSGSSNATIEAKVQLNPCQTSYQLGITAMNSQQGTYSKLPVLRPAKWATITLRLDPRSATATFFLDGRAFVSARYNPQQFRSLKEIGIVTGLGDGSKWTD